MQHAFFLINSSFLKLPHYQYVKRGSDRTNLKLALPLKYKSYKQRQQTSFMRYVHQPCLPNSNFFNIFLFCVLNLSLLCDTCIYGSRLSLLSLLALLE